MTHFQAAIDVAKWALTGAVGSGVAWSFGILLGRVLLNYDISEGPGFSLLQAVSAEAPQYHVVSASGPDHDRVFECIVQHGGIELARGRGKSKKAAESEAALAALIKLREKKEVA